ncbi:YfiR family protein [Duganella sp. CT11-25]|jgi:hypothetical protein|uniref:YfiR family protein n=1 Tax=unclassified Duganella TaxID=2636909 RepID=UPI0039AEC5A4
MRLLGAWRRIEFAARACLLAALMVVPAVPSGAGEAIPEQQIKAAYILNFARYASWPALTDPRAPLVLCLAGPGAAEIGRQLQSRTAGSHPLELRTVSRVDEMESCHALYIAVPERARQNAWLTRLRDQAVLTIGDSAGFLADGGIINLVPVDGSIRFEVNLTAARHAGVVLHPRMLALAERVVGGEGK